MTEKSTYKIILDNEENRFFITDKDVKTYIDTSKFILLTEEDSGEKLFINTDHIVVVSEVKNIILKSKFIL
ncbi:MAG: hypothetical protein WBH44_10245 [Proteocatella sp.]